MASIDRYRPAREGYQPPSLPPKPPPVERHSRSPSRRHDIPPAVPSPPTLSSRTSPPRPFSRRSAHSPAQSSPLAPPRLHGSQWFFSPDELASTPSIIDGLSPAEEQVRRAKGVNFIYQAGICHEPHPFPQLTLWVAATFLHRFYMRYSMVEDRGGIHHYNIAATALFLANKTEESCFKTKGIIVAVAKVAQKNPKLIIDEQSKEYWRWRDSILMHEELMLEILTFDLNITHPYDPLYETLKKLQVIHVKRLRNSAWTFCNDTALTSLPLLMDGEEIAMAAIFCASVQTGEKIDDIDGVAWWTHVGADEDRMKKAIDVLYAFYIENPLKKQDSQIQGSPEFKLETTRRRGETIASQTDGGSSQGGTPMDTDRATQSPRDRANGRIDRDEEDTGSVPPVLETGRGDSDAALKTAANDLDVHRGKPNWKGLASPGGGRKRKSAEPEFDSETEREQKRARQSDEDEGEVRDA